MNALPSLITPDERKALTRFARAFVEERATVNAQHKLYTYAAAPDQGWRASAFIGSYTLAEIDQDGSIYLKPHYGFSKLTIAAMNAIVRAVGLPYGFYRESVDDHSPFMTPLTAPAQTELWFTDNEGRHLVTRGEPFLLCGPLTRLALKAERANKRKPDRVQKKAA